MNRKDENSARLRDLFSSSDGNKIKESLFNSRSHTYTNKRQVMEECFNKNETETDTVLECEKPYASGDFLPKVTYKEYTSADGWRFHKKNKHKSMKKK